MWLIGPSNRLLSLPISGTSARYLGTWFWYVCFSNHGFPFLNLFPGNSASIESLLESIADDHRVRKPLLFFLTRPDRFDRFIYECIIPPAFWVPNFDLKDGKVIVVKVKSFYVFVWSIHWCLFRLYMKFRDFFPLTKLAAWDGSGMCIDDAKSVSRSWLGLLDVYPFAFSSCSQSCNSCVW